MVLYTIEPLLNIRNPSNKKIIGNPFFKMHLIFFYAHVSLILFVNLLSARCIAYLYGLISRSLC